MVYFWTGIFFLSSSGLFLYPIYGEQDMKLWPYVLGLGFILNIVGCYRYPEFKIDPNIYGNDKSAFNKTPLQTNHNILFPMFLVPIIFGIYTFRFPYSLPLYSLGVGLILTYVLRWDFLRHISRGVLFSGLILVFQTAFIIPYFKIAARYHEINIFTPFFYLILKGLGIPCSYSQDKVFVQTTQANVDITTSWERIGLFVFLMFLVGAITFLYLLWENRAKNRFWKNIGILMAVVVSYIIARYVFFTVIFVEFSNPKIFWKPILVSLSYLPLPFILFSFIRGDKSGKSCFENSNNNEGQVGLVESNTQKWLSFKTLLFAGIASFFFAFALISCFWFQDPGQVKKGRVLIDEFHSNWEWTDKEFNTKWFGIQSVYNYYCFADYLNHFYRVRRLREEISTTILDQCDVFIIKTPTLSFSEKEMDDIVKFVKNGGGLFLVGDHTNVFGTTNNMNPLSERFGFWFNYDATYDLIDSDLHFHKQNRLFVHPSIKYMPYFLFATSCSMDAPFFAEDTMIASNLKTMYLDYARGGYFPEKNKVLDYTFGLFLQSSAVKYGKGRVMAFADSTCFSNFYMHIPGKPEYALGVINWLNRVNSYNVWNKVISFIVMTISCGFIVYLFYIIRVAIFNNNTDNPTNLFLSVNGVVCVWPSKIVRVLLFGALFGICSSVLLFDTMGEKQYKLPKEHTPMVKIGFEEKACNFNIPSRKLLHNPGIDFQTFYVWPQRLDYVPTLFSLDEPLDEFDMVVMVHPRKYFKDEDLKKINNYVEKGGKLLLIDYPKGIRSSANQIMNHFGMRFEHAAFKGNVEIHETNFGKIGTIKAMSPVTGGDSLLKTKDGFTFATALKHGEGLIVALACSTSFTNEEMGNTEAIPNEHQQFLYRLEFWLLSSLINGHFESFTNFSVE